MFSVVIKCYERLVYVELSCKHQFLQNSLWVLGISDSLHLILKLLEHTGSCVTQRQHAWFKAFINRK